MPPDCRPGQRAGRRDIYRRWRWSQPGGQEGWHRPRLGSQRFRQLGNNSTTDSTTPVQVSGLSNALSVSAGQSHSLALEDDGTASTWGDNFRGQLGATSSGTCGSGSTWACSLTPLSVSSLTNLAAVVAGANFSLGLKQNGEVWSWGENDNGELAIGSTDTNVHSTPVHASTNLDGSNTIAAGVDHGLASKSLIVQPAPAGNEHNPPYIHQGVSRLGVDTLTGSFSTSAIGAGPSAGMGPSPVLTYTHNTNDPRVSPLGPGWTHNYSTHLAGAGNGSGAIVLVGPQGRSDRYVPINFSSGIVSYAQPDGVSTELRRNSNGTYTATFLDLTTWEFDNSGRLRFIRDRFTNESELTYNSTTGRLSSVSDPAGRGTLSFSYDSSGRLTSVSDWDTTPRVIGFEYVSATDNRLQSVTDRAGGETTFGYDGSSHRVATITDSNNKPLLSQTFDSRGRVATQKDGRGLLSGGQETSFSYPSTQDGTTPTVVTEPTTSAEPTWHSKVEDTYTADRGFLSKRVNKPTSTQSPATEFTYDGPGFTSSIEDPRDHASTLCFDVGYDGQPTGGQRGKLTRVISVSPDGTAAPLVTLHAYDSSNNLTQTVPPKGVTNSGSVSCSTDLSSQVQSAFATDFAYDSSTHTKIESVTRHFTDDDEGSKTVVTKYEFDTAHPGLISKVIPPRGNTSSSPDYSFATEFEYFGNADGCKDGLLKTVRTPVRDGQSSKDATNYDYDCNANRIQTVDPLGHAWDFEYDDQNRLTISTTPAVTIQGESGTHRLTTTYEYDAAGMQTVRISPSNNSSGQVTKFVYDERELLKEVRENPGAWTDPDASDPTGTEVTAYLYDDLGSRTKVTRAQGITNEERVVDYTYDGLGRVMSEIQHPTTSSTFVSEFTYDLNGNRATHTDPLDQLTTFSYDNLDRLTGISYSQRNTTETTSTTNVTYGYDRHSNRTSMTDVTGTTTYDLDELDRLTSVTWPGSSTKTIEYRYDLDGNRRRVTYSDLTDVDYSFDKAGRMSSLTDWDGRTVAYAYAPDSRLLKVTNWTSNGTTTDYTYDDARRLTDILHKQGSTVLSAHGFGLDRQGDRTRFDEQLPTISSTEFGPLGTSGLGSSEVFGTDGSSDFVAAGFEPTALPDFAELAAAAQSAQPRSPRKLEPFTDHSAVAGKASLFEAKPGKGAYKLELFDKNKAAATVRLEHAFSGAVLRFELPGAASERKAQGAKASAKVGDATLQWTGFADGLKEDIILDKRPAKDEVRFKVEMQRLAPAKDGKGGYVLYDSYAYPRFHVMAPTVHDANGRSGKATLSLTTKEAVIQVDPTFMNTATFPVTIDPTVNWTLDSPATTFAYDRYAPVAQLTAVAAQQGPESHSSYDYAANRNRMERVQGPTQPTPDQTTTTYDYDGADHILTATHVDASNNTVVVDYDVNPNGNLRFRSGGTICDEFKYDQANRMTQALVNDGCGTSTTNTYVYNGDGLRTSKTVGSNGAIRYVWDVNRGLPTILEDGTRKYAWGAQGLSHNQQLGSTSPTTVEVYHADQIGTIRELTAGDDGELTDTYTYDEFGVPTERDGTSSQPFGYTGELWDGGTGEPNLLYLRARSYDPGTGRFMQRDPTAGSVDETGTLNRYAYAHSNSINRRDPFGLDYIGVDGPTVPDWAQPPPVTCLVPSLFGGCLIWAATPTGSGKEKAFLPAPNRMRVQLQRGLSDRPEDNYGVSLEDDTGRGVTALDVKFAVIELSWDYRTSNAIREAIAAWFPEIQRELSAIVLSGGVSGFKRSFRSWPLPNGWRLDLDQLAGTNLTSED